MNISQIAEELVTREAQPNAWVKLVGNTGAQEVWNAVALGEEPGKIAGRKERKKAK